MHQFESINKGYNSIFKFESLSIGLVIPIENYGQHTVPTLNKHLKRVQLAEELGFKAVWVRDVPLHVPTFGDAGQTLDPFTYLGYLAAQTKTIALCTGSIALPLHHPVHIVKSAATLDYLSDGRIVLGVASGDRPEEFPGLGFSFEERGEAFREAFTFIRTAQESFPNASFKTYGTLDGRSDVLPKAKNKKLPLLITGHSRQSIDWIAENGDGWMYYPRNFYMQEHNIKDFRSLALKLSGHYKPFMQPLYVDLHENDNFEPQHIHLGFRLGANYLIEYFNQLKSLGVNHVGVNLRFNQRPIEETLTSFSEKILSNFH